jgi:Polyketide cyclase / dehydrase and lipid transport
MQDRDEGGQMAAIAHSIEISRRPADVFSYATDYSHFPQWQRRVVSALQEGKGPVAVGTRAAVTRRVGPRQLLTTEEITELNPPRAWQVRGTGRIPVVAIAKGTIEPLGEGQRSLVTIALEFHGRGIGRLLAPLIRYQSGKQLPKDGKQLKELLEHG